MSAFEFYFSFFGLILGIAVANVGIGFGRLWRARERASIGLCLPLVGFWLLCHSVLNWVNSWEDLQSVPISAASLFVGIFVALPYVVVSTVMFPEDADQHESLDAFYLSHARLVMVAMSVPTLSGMLGRMYFGQVFTPAQLVDLFAGYFLIPLILFFWRNLRVHQIGLALAVANLLWRLFR